MKMPHTGFAHVWFVFGIALVLIAGYVAYVAYPIYKAIHQTKSLMTEAVPYEQHPTNTANSTKPSITILVAGDSTAVGTGAATNTESTAGRIGAQYPNAEVVNIGVNGLKLEGLLEKFQAMPASEHYTLIVLQIGANDIVGMTPLPKVSSELSQVLTLATAHASHVVVITAGDVGLAPVFRFPLSTLFEWRTLQVRKIFMEEISTYKNISYVDLFKYRNTEIFNTDIGKFYAADHFHPSGAGYAVWYESMSPAIAKALGN